MIVCAYVCVIFKHLHSTDSDIVGCLYERKFENDASRKFKMVLFMNDERVKFCVRASSPNFFCLVKDLLCRIRQKGIMREYIFSRRRRRRKNLVLGLCGKCDILH